MKKTKIFTLSLFVFLFTAILSISAFAAPDETDAYLQQYIFSTKNFYHMREFNDYYKSSNGNLAVTNSFSLLNNKTDFDVYFPGVTIGSERGGFYVAKCGTCIDGEENCYINPVLYGANLGVVSVWLELPKDTNELPRDYVFDPNDVNFYFTNSYGDWFYYAGTCELDGSTYFVYCKFYYTTQSGYRMKYHNIALEFGADFGLPVFSCYTGLEYYNVNLDDENISASLYGLMVAGLDGGCLSRPPSAHITDAEEAYLFGLSVSEDVKGFYNAGYEKGEEIGYGNGYNVGRDTGYDIGFYDGEKQGYNDGEAVGYKNGEQIGYVNGFQSGYSEGYKIGGDYNGVTIALTQAIKNNGNQIASALDGESDGTVVEGFLAGMWNGMTNFMQTLLSGITLSGLSLMNIVATFLAILMAAYVIKLTRG